MLSVESKSNVLDQFQVILLAGEIRLASDYPSQELLDLTENAIADRVGLLTADFAAKKAPKGKKDCNKGKICKGSCIAKTKTCLGDMNPAQLKAHKSAQAAARKAKAGGGGGGTPDNVATPAIVPVVTPIVASRKNFEFPSDSDLKAAKKEPLGGDPDDTLNAKDIFTADINGQKFFIKGNSPLEKDWEGWDNIDKTTMAKQLKSEVATKEIADLVGVGEYYLPIKEYGRGRTAKVVTPFIDATPAWDVNVEKLSMHEPDRRKLLALDYALGALDRHGGNVMIDKDGKPYMIDNGLNFGKHLGRGQTNYYAWSNNSNFLKSGMNLYDEQLDRSHIQGIVNNKASIIKIAKDKGLDYKSVEKRINELDAAKTWDDIL